MNSIKIKALQRFLSTFDQQSIHFSKQTKLHFCSNTSHFLLLIPILKRTVSLRFTERSQKQRFTRAPEKRSLQGSPFHRPRRNDIRVGNVALHTSLYLFPALSFLRLFVQQILQKKQDNASFFLTRLYTKKQANAVRYKNKNRRLA